MKHLKQERPQVYQAFMDMAEKIESSHFLPGKTKELIKLASCLTQGSTFGVGLHVRSAYDQGASKDEIIDTIVLCLPTAGISLTNQAFEIAMGTLKMI